MILLDFHDPVVKNLLPNGGGSPLAGVLDLWRQKGNQRRAAMKTGAAKINIHSLEKEVQ